MSVIACDQFLLADMAALASQSGSPVAPYPVFFTSGNCGENAGTSEAAFPLYYFPVDCKPGWSSPTDNCLRVIDNLDRTFDPYTYTGLLAPEQVNVLPNADITPHNTIFTDPNARLYSWYVPPQYRIIFMDRNPTEVPLATILAETGPLDGKFLDLPGNTLEPDACASKLTLANFNYGFFKYGSYENPTAANVPCPLQYCACGTVNPIEPGVPGCDGPPVPTTSPTPVACPGVAHQAPFFIVIKNLEFSDMIFNMCTKNTQYTLGSDPNNSLNRVWKPQSSACDQYMTNICSTSDVTLSQYKETCACFTQQQALNVQYGPTLEVPVCCFGADPSGDINKSCYFDTNAYKTGLMSRNCCSFAECTQVVNQNPTMQADASPPGEIQCVGSFVQFPVVPSAQPVVIPSALIVDIYSVPIYVWILFAVAVVLLLAFIFVLLFV